jgi:hypothetical protein
MEAVKETVAASFLCCKLDFRLAAAPGSAHDATWSPTPPSLRVLQGALDALKQANPGTRDLREKHC